MGKRLTVAQHRRRWGMWTAVVVFIAAGATAVVAFAKADLIDPRPWGYLALIVAVFAALTAMALAFAMAVIESRGDK